MLSHIAILMENQPGALSRVVGLFSQRGYNIDSLSVAPTQDPTLSRLTMTTSENPEIVNQILRQLYKLCLLYTSPSPRDATLSRMPSSA